MRLEDLRVKVESFGEGLTHEEAQFLLDIALEKHPNIVFLEQYNEQLKQEKWELEDEIEELRDRIEELENAA